MGGYLLPKKSFCVEKGADPSPEKGEVAHQKPSGGERAICRKESTKRQVLQPPHGGSRKKSCPKPMKGLLRKKGDKKEACLWKKKAEKK